MLNGTDDAMLSIATARRQAELAKRRVPTLQFREIQGDHFFLLDNRKDTFAAVRDFLTDGQLEDRKAKRLLACCW